MPRLIEHVELPAGGDYLSEQSEGDHVVLAPYHGGQAGHGWSGLRNGLDDQRPSRARDHRCGLDSWDLARKDSWRFSYGIGLEVRTGRARTSLGYRAANGIVSGLIN